MNFLRVSQIPIYTGSNFRGFSKKSTLNRIARDRENISFQQVDFDSIPFCGVIFFPLWAGSVFIDFTAKISEVFLRMGKLNSLQTNEEILNDTKRIYASGKIGTFVIPCDSSARRLIEPLKIGTSRVNWNTRQH